MKRFIIFIISFFALLPVVSAVNTISLLHGNRLVTYTTPIDAQVTLTSALPGVVLHDKTVYVVDGSIVKLNEEILQLKKQQIRENILSARENITLTRSGKQNGFVTSQDLRQAQQALTELMILEKENEKAMRELELKKQHLTLKIPGYFIIRNQHAYDGGWLKEGDKIISIEYLDELQLDIKVDPLMLLNVKPGTGVNWRSLISGKRGTGTILNITQDDDISSGLKKVIIATAAQQKTELLSLIDTPFEVSFNDQAE